MSLCGYDFFHIVFRCVCHLYSHFTHGIYRTHEEEEEEEFLP